MGQVSPIRAYHNTNDTGILEIVRGRCAPMIGGNGYSCRLGIFVTHPIQYFAPLWRALAASPGIECTVHFFSDGSVRGSKDPGFGVPVAWDVPVLDGYHHEFIARDADLSDPGAVQFHDAASRISRGHFDAVMVHGYVHRFEHQVARMARRNGVQLILRGEFTDVSRGHRRSWLRRAARDAYLRWFYRQVDRFCYIGEEARRHLVRLRIPDQRMFFSPYSVDTALFEAQHRSFTRSACRAALGIGDDQLVLLFSGKLIPRKAPLLLLEALERLSDIDRVVLIVVGDGELRAKVGAAATRILDDRVRMVGFVNQSQLGRYYSAADVHVLPSDYETWGLVVNETMQFGLPSIVSSKVGCQRDLVLHGKTGMVFEQGDSASLAHCLKEFAADSTLAARLGANARAHIAAYSTEASVEGIRQALRAR